MKKPTVAIIGHFVQAPNVLPAAANGQEARTLLKQYNYTRVVDDGGKFVDHLTYLRNAEFSNDRQTFSVWEMYLCAGLLLSSHLKRNGYDTKLVNYIDSENEAQVLREIRSFEPDIVLLSTTFVLSKNHLVFIGKKIREEIPNAWIVAGGHHVYTTLLTMNDEQRGHYLLSANLDGFVYDVQGEHSLLQLCRNFPDRIDRTPNLIWRKSSSIVVHNQRIPENNDINDTLIEFDDSFRDSIVHIRTARSCGFKCAFCSYPTIAGDLALMDIDNVMTTLHGAKDCGVKAVIFVDDTFNVPRPRFESLVERMIAEDLELPWYSFLRCQYVDRGLIKKMRQSGCAGVFLGIESGSDAMLKRMKKGAISRFYRDGVRWLREEGITTVGSFIIGFPGETTETVEQTRDYIQNSGLDYYFIQPFYYLHHTPVHKRAEEYGLKGGGLMWSHDTMNWSEAIAHINRLFLEIDGPTFINPDYTLWEIAYLRSKGMGLEAIRTYRAKINEMTRAQMSAYGIYSENITSRSA